MNKLILDGTRYMLKQFRFVLCCAGGLLIYQTNEGVLFYMASMTAFANLFSAQLMCGMQGCQTQKTGIFKQDPVALFHYGTTIAGIIFCLLGAFYLGIF